MSTNKNNGSALQNKSFEYPKVDLFRQETMLTFSVHATDVTKFPSDVKSHSLVT